MTSLLAAESGVGGADFAIPDWISDVAPGSFVAGDALSRRELREACAAGAAHDAAFALADELSGGGSSRRGMSAPSSAR